MRLVTVIIPTWNMGRFLDPLTRSILSTPFAEHVEEIIFVCEKSTDGSEAIIESLRQAQGERLPRLRLLQPERRNGLFVARYLGAKAATTKKIMFIDSRITLPESSGRAMAKLIYDYPALTANVDIDVHKNVFCLYWQRSHAAIFRRTFAANLNLNKVTAENFDQNRIGGTCFFCSRDLFVEVSERYLHRKTYSDDTLIMRDMVQVEPFFVHPEFRVQWEPRDKTRAFLKHLYVRGPGFAEYHFFEKRGWLFFLVLSGLVFLIFTLILLIYKPLLATSILLSGLLTLFFSTALIAKSASEFLMLAPLHTGVLLAYGFGALKGAWVIWKIRRAARLANKDDPAA